MIMHDMRRPPLQRLLLVLTATAVTVGFAWWSLPHFTVRQEVPVAERSVICYKVQRGEWGDRRPTRRAIIERYELGEPLAQANSRSGDHPVSGAIRLSLSPNVQIGTSSQSCGP